MVLSEAGIEDMCVFMCVAVRMAASLGFPFTSAQWRELERQAMIYKYMMASAPIPPELLIPTCRNTSDPAASHSHCNHPCSLLWFFIFYFSSSSFSAYFHDGLPHS